MSNEKAARLRPVLVPGANGSLVGFYHPALGVGRELGDVLVVPAFAEEMNRCRSMVTMLAASLATLGMGTLVLDLGGTGDSGGSFEQATWDGWRDDLLRGIQWLRTNGQGCRTLLGVRLGSLMAAELATADPGIDRLLLWMPVVSGKTHWTQFLRIRLAAEMADPNGVKSTDELRKQTANGLAVEASGYSVGPDLAARLDQLAMPAGTQLKGKSVAWFEVSANPDSPLPRPSVKVLDEWRLHHVAATAEQVVGPPFWQVHERDVAPRLIEASVAAVARWQAPWPLGGKVVADGPQAMATMAGVSPLTEYPVAFGCEGADLAGLIHRGRPGAALGVVIVVAGGPQYRAGAHRQFVSLARLFASEGYPVLRFDLRGMGDSGGEYLGYHHSRADIRLAIDELQRRDPTVANVALFGECESASGILFYACLDPRVTKIALANPWVRTAEGQAEVILKHYYLDRLRSPVFWRNVREGKFDWAESLRSFASVLRHYWKGRKAKKASGTAADMADFDQLPLPAKTAEGLRRFRGQVLLLMSGRDYIAREFDEVTKSHLSWKGLLADPRVTRKDIADADHTFSKPEAKAEAHRALLHWLSG